MKSSFSGKQGQCIDVSRLGQDGDVLKIVETEDLYNAVYTSPENFAAFIAGVKAGEFDHFAVREGSLVIDEQTLVDGTVQKR